MHERAQGRRSPRGWRGRRAVSGSSRWRSRVRLLLRTVGLERRDIRYASSSAVSSSPPPYSRPMATPARPGRRRGRKAGAGRSQHDRDHQRSVVRMPSDLHERVDEAARTTCCRPSAGRPRRHQQLLGEVGPSSRSRASAPPPRGGRTCRVAGLHLLAIIMDPASLGSSSGTQPNEGRVRPHLPAFQASTASHHGVVSPSLPSSKFPIDAQLRGPATVKVVWNMSRVKAPSTAIPPCRSRPRSSLARWA